METIFFILYLKRAIEKMKAINYSNQIKEQSNNLVNGIVDDKLNNDSKEYCNIFNIKTGSYEVIYDYFEDVSLMKDNKILYKLDDYHGKRILINLINKFQFKILIIIK